MYLGLDLGTSGVKAMLIDGDQHIVAHATGALEQSRPHPGWSEQDPAAWVAATEDAVGQLKADQWSCARRAAKTGLCSLQSGNKCY